MNNTNEMDFSSVVGLAPGLVPPAVPPTRQEILTDQGDFPPTYTVVKNLPAVMNMNIPRAALEPYRKRAEELKEEAKSLKVSDQASQIAATSLAAGIKKIAKTIEDARKEYTAPVNDHIKSVNGLATEISAPLNEGLRHLTGQLNQYAAQVELDRRKAEEESRRQAEAEQKRLDAEAKAAGVVAPLVPEVLPARGKAAAVRTEAGTSFQRKTWTFSVENVEKVPREYMVLNESAVRAAIKNGVRSIPGLKIFETAGTVIR